MESNNSIVVQAQMLIHRPVAQVFEAFVNPQITTKFWFTKSSGRLELGKKVRWDWEMFGIGDDLTVKEFEENQRILFVFNYGTWPYEDKLTWVCTHSDLQSLEGANLIVVEDIDDVVSGAAAKGIEHLWLAGW